MKKRYFRYFLAALFAYGAYIATMSDKEMPPLKDGDIVFQSTWTDQTIAIGLASMSFFIHTGIVKHGPDGWVVVQAADTVRETPLQEWINQGVWRRFSVYRDKNLTPEKAAKILEAAHKYYGRHYDHYFSFDNDDIYCSELVYLAFKDGGTQVGHAVKAGALYLNNAFTRKLIEQRWKKYPACKGKDLTFDQCYDIIMGQEIITPYDISADPQLEKIFSNYPW